MSFTPDTPGSGFNPQQPCTNPSHFPPGMWVPPGPGVWTCPSCGQKTRVGGRSTVS